MALPQATDARLDALFAQAKQFHNQKDFAHAANLYQQIVTKDPSRLTAWANFARCHISMGHGEYAVPVFSELVRQEPKQGNHKTMLAYALSTCSADAAPDMFKDAISICLNEKNLYHEWVYSSWLSYLKAAPEFSNLWQEPTLLEAVTDPFLTQGLKIFRAADRDLEVSLRTLRAICLEAALETPDTLTPYTDFLNALADQCFHTEYAYALKDGEMDKAERLSARRDPVSLLVYACYRPLFTLRDQNDFAHFAANQSGPLADTLTQQFFEPLREEEIKKSILSIGSIADPVSKKVRAQYEVHPYPRWKNASLPLLQLDARPLRILIAGCGTGRQIAYTAQSFPNAHIIAIDLSTTSLAFAIRQGEKLGYNDRVAYRHMDILDLPTLGASFDIIFCTGVLHHMDDPMAGWKALCDVSTDQTTMKIGLYSALARKTLDTAREIIGKEFATDTDDGIRAARAHLMHAHQWNDLTFINGSMDFYSLSACRDLLFHVQEHQFTLPQIQECLNALDLEFIQFDFTNPRIAEAYRARFPADAAMTNLTQWHAFECEHPDIFGEMYQFHVRKRRNAPRIDKHPL